LRERGPGVIDEEDGLQTTKRTLLAVGNAQIQSDQLVGGAYPVTLAGSVLVL
jgi:hypothetical protein